MTIPTIEPQSFTAGDTVQWTKSLKDYPASAGWVVTYTAINGSAKFTATSTADGDLHAITLAAAATAAYVAGSYYFEGYVSKAGQRFTISTGWWTVAPNITASTTLDARSHARKTLAAIQAVIEGRASIDQQEYTIGNRSLKRTPIADLLVLMSKYETLVKSEDNALALAQGRPTKNRILVRF